MTVEIKIDAVVDGWRSMNGPPWEVVKRAEMIAAQSPCAKSKRGAVLFIQREANAIMLAGAYNGPPSPVVCLNNEACRRDCGKRCVHAEARAVRGVYERRLWPPDDIAKMEIVHVKIGADGKVVAGGGPSCVMCSREMLDAGIGAVWLYQAYDGDCMWTRYTAEGFHAATCHNLEIV